MLVSGGHRPKDVLGWSEHERQVAASAAMQLEVWRLEQLGKMLGAE